MAKVTMAEVRRLRARVRELEREREAMRRRWVKEEWPGEKGKPATFIGRISNPGPANIAQVDTARRLFHAVVVTVDGVDLVLWADPIPAT